MLGRVGTLSVPRTSARLGAGTRATSAPRRRHPLFRGLDAGGGVGLLLVALVVVVAILAPLIEPRDPLAQDIARRLKPPGYVDARAGSFWLGTDGLGRDMLSRLIEGARVSLLVGASSTLISAVLGTTLGLTAGYLGGWWDALIMRVVDVFQAIPFTILAIAVAELGQHGARRRRADPRRLVGVALPRPCHSAHPDGHQSGRRLAARRARPAPACPLSRGCGKPFWVSTPALARSRAVCSRLEA